jgi:hypothetical protein
MGAPTSLLAKRPIGQASIGLRGRHHGQLIQVHLQSAGGNSTYIAGNVMSALFDRARMNHLEVTVAQGALASTLHDLLGFYCEVLGFGHTQMEMFAQRQLILTTDAVGSQFLYIAEHAQPMRVGGDDHLGFHMPNREAVDRVLHACRQWRESDERMQIQELPDLNLPQTLTHAFYFRYLLPIWFDVQVIEFKPGFEPKHGWTFA